MLEQARNKLNSLSTYTDVDWELIEASAIHLPFPDNSFDHVVDTFGLCVFDNPHLALKEIRRVCKKGGTILLLEHSLSPYGLVQEYQRWTGSLVAKLSKGCDWSLPLQDLLKLHRLYTIYQKYTLLGTVSLNIVSK
ncbi:Phosphatidylethanolamine N-methyltransferase [Galdieria sulphuraria]|nr:Phosphatidylethanolamine N-methyltransferase [Galdieria sulphuraria]